MKRSIICTVTALSVAVMMFSCKNQDGDERQAKNSNRAVITFSLGDSFRFNDNKWDRVGVGTALVQNDRIKTSPGALLDLQIGSSVVRLKEKTELILAQLFRDGTTGVEKSSLELSVGKVLVSPRKLLKDENFYVKTPTAVAGVRGTKFMVTADKAKDTQISVIEGSVRVSKRIRALETAQETDGHSAQVAKQIQEQIEQESVVITENKSCQINSQEVEKVNAKVEKIVASVAAEAEAPEPKIIEQQVQQAMKVVAETPPIEVTKITPVEQDLGEEFKNMRVVEVNEEKKIQKGDLQVMAYPGNSQLYVNGELAGTGSISMKLLPGKYSVKAVAPGFEDSEREYNITAGKMLVETLSLTEVRPLSRIKWNRSIGDVATSVVYGANVVYIATANGEIAAVDREDSTNKWKTSLGQGITSGLGISADKLFMTTADEMLVAVSRKDGKKLWSQKITGSLINGIAPIVSGNYIYAATSKGHVYSFNVNSRERWDENIPAAVLEAPVLTSRMLMVPAINGKLYAFDADDGSVEWTADVGTRFKAAYSGKKIYAVSFHGKMNAIDAEKGKSIWQRDLGEKFVVPPLLIGNRLYLGSTDGILMSIDAVTGKVLFRRDLGGAITNDITLSNNTLYVAARNRLVSVDLRGRVQWAHPMDSRIVTSASTSGDEVFVALADGRLVSVNKVPK
ncbi:MAG TPA: PQQ-binding-like beta-propeller repeat protein [Spirochaetota bacterium]|nr:PQQ-binding-like beta-propeller repeat protein [Spirochaetota bacterium]